MKFTRLLLNNSAAQSIYCYHNVIFGIAWCLLSTTASISIC